MIAGLKRWVGKFPDLGDVVRRFPIPVAVMAVFTLLIIFKDFFADKEDLARLCGGLVVAGYLCVSVVLASESRGKSPNIILQLAIAIVIAALAWFSKTLHLNIPMAIGAAVLLLGNAVIWRQARDDLHVWDFTHKLWTGAIFAAVGSFIFTLGMFAISAALKNLFGIKIDDLIEYFFLPIGLGFLAPLYWMATLPPVDEDYSELYDTPGFESKAVSFLGTWLLSPLTLIYALILLAYGVKIVAAGELPKGEIAGLTTPFLVVGTLTWLVLDPPFARSKPLARLFKTVWWPVSIPAGLLLAVAVFVRIREYGYTPERVALTALIVWALGLAMWFTFAPKARRDIRFIPGFAAVLLAAGALGAGWLSLLNQSARFESNLMASGVVSAEGSVSDTPVITDMDAARKAKGALRYLMRHEGKDRVAEILSDISVPFDVADDTQESVLKSLGLENVKDKSRWADPDSLFYSREDNPVPIAGFDTLYGPFNTYEQQFEHWLFQTENISAKTKDGRVIIIANGVETDFEPAKWIDAQNFKIGDVKIENPVVTIVEDGDVKVSLVVNNFNRWIREDDVAQPNGFNIDFYILTAGAE